MTFEDIFEAVLLLIFVNPELNTALILFRPLVTLAILTGAAFPTMALMDASIRVLPTISDAERFSLPVAFSSVWPIKVDAPEPIAEPAIGPVYKVATPPINPPTVEPTYVSQLESCKEPVDTLVTTSLTTWDTNPTTAPTVPAIKSSIKLHSPVGSMRIIGLFSQ